MINYFNSISLDNRHAYSFLIFVLFSHFSVCNMANDNYYNYLLMYFIMKALLFFITVKFARKDE